MFLTFLLLFEKDNSEIKGNEWKAEGQRAAKPKSHWYITTICNMVHSIEKTKFSSLFSFVVFAVVQVPLSQLAFPCSEKTYFKSFHHWDEKQGV